MKKIKIVGANSYIARNVILRLEQRVSQSVNSNYMIMQKNRWMDNQIILL